MIQEHETVCNPVVGHRVTFLQTGAETDGELLQIEYAVERPEDGPAAIVPEHLHLQSEERFEVLAGTLGVLLEGKEHLLHVGDFVTIKPGLRHTFWNAGDGELRFLTDIRPAGGFQTFWETTFGLAADGRVDKNGLPDLLQLAVLAPYADSYRADIPVSLSKLLLAVLGTIGRWRGYRAEYSPASIS